MHRDAGPAGAHTNLLEVHFVTKAGPCWAKGLIRRRSPKEALVKIAPPFSLRYAEYVEDSGTALFQRICELDLEGIVAKHKSGPCIVERENSTWFKIRNRGYSPMQGREEVFERERHKEPVPGWPSCVIACAELE